MARLLSPPSWDRRRRKSDSTGGVLGSGFFFTTRQTDFHSLSANTAVQGSLGQVRLRYVKYKMRQAMIL